MNREAEDRFFSAARVEAGDSDEVDTETPDKPDIKPSRPDITGR
jgi:hypothetical protein